MKRILYLSIISGLLLFSCKKEHNKSGNDNTLHNVSFTVNGFTQTSGPFSVTGNKHTITDAVKASAISANAYTPDSTNGKTYIVYSVYDATGKYIHSITQSSDQANFGTLTDNLIAGNYTVNIAAYPGLLDAQGSYAPYYLTGYATALSSAVLAYSDGRPQFIDTFSKTFGITVSATSTINQNVTLARINGELELAITDSSPSNVTEIAVTVSNEYLEYNVATSNPDTLNHNGPMMFYAYTHASFPSTNFTFSGIVLNTIHPFTATITCYDVSNNVIALKTVNNVYCQVNKTTILSGNLFGSQTGNSTDGFTVSINPAWNLVQDTVKFSSIRRTINRVNR